MANRKVLINRHTSGSSAPQANSMYLGEIAVAHRLKENPNLSATLSFNSEL